MFWASSHISRGVLFALLGAAVLCAPVECAYSQERPDSLQRVLEKQTERVELLRRLSRTVIAIFPANPEDINKPARRQLGRGGSGVIIDAQGHALTNYHVVLEADSVNVGLPDGRVCQAAVLGRDPTGDIALIKIDDGPFHFAELGDSDTLKRGESVYVLGNPFGFATDFKPTVSHGIVSALHRYLPGSDTGDLIYTDCIQVDAPINPGNSGGPLFNSSGKLVGINGRVSLRRDRGRVNAGVGFAISINQIKEFLPGLRAGKLVHHAVLGVDLDHERGAVTITEVIPDSAADKVGLKKDDVVSFFNGHRIESKTQLVNLIGILPAGKTVRMRIARDGRNYEIEVALGTRPTGIEAANGDSPVQTARAKDEPPPLPGIPQALTAQKIADLYAEAIGGYEALAEVEDVVMTGRMTLRAPGGGMIRAKLVQYLILPFQVRQEVTYFRAGRRIRRAIVFDGRSGWKQTPTKVEGLTPEEVADVAANLTALDNISKPDGLKNSRAQYVGTDVLDGKTLVLMITRDPDNSERRWFFDPKTWFLVRYVRRSRSSGLVVEDRLSDYRRIGRLYHPFNTVHYERGQKVHETQLEKVEINRGIGEQVLRERPVSKVGRGVY